MKIDDTPAYFRDDLTNTINYLSSIGLQEIYLFGSIAANNSTKDSDIDIAVRGIKPEDFFKVYGELLMISKHPVDLIDLNLQEDFGNTLIQTGALKRVTL